MNRNIISNKNHGKKYLVLFIIFWASAGIAQTTDYWQQTNGPEGGDVRVLRVDPTTNDIFIYFNTGDLYKSSNQGQSWQLLPPPPIGIYDMTITTSGELYIIKSGSADLYKSADGGSTWTKLPANGLTSNTNTIKYDPYSGYLFIGTNYGGVWRSTDDGLNWTPQLNGLNNYQNLRMWKFYIHTNGQIYVGAWEWSQVGGIYVSTDKGDSWTQINGDIANTNIRDIAINNSGHIFAATYGGAVYRSINNGTNWIRKSSGIDSYLSHIIILPNQYVLAGSVQDGIFLSTNNGDEWVNPIPEPSDFGVQSLKYDTVNQQIFAALDGAGVISSATNGSSWVFKNTGLKHFYGNDLHIDNANSVYASAYSASIYRSRNNGDSWEEANNGLTSVSAKSIASKPGYLFLGTMFSGIFRSTNSGDSWEDISGGGGYTGQVTYVFVSSKGYLFAQTGTAYSLNKSLDNGDSWNEVRSTEYQDGVAVMAEDSSAGILYAGLNGGGMIRSLDDGESWTLINNGLTQLNIRSLLVLPSGDVLAGTGSGLFRTGNNGDEWYESSLPVSGEVQSLEIDDLSQIFSCVSSFVYRSSDDGVTWDLINSGLLGTHVDDLEIDNDNMLYALTRGSGVFKSINPTILPEIPVLSSPFNGQTDVNNPPVLSWDSAAVAQTYDLQVAVDASFSNVAYQVGGLEQTTHEASGLNDGTVYYWHVRAVNPLSLGEWSGTWSFTTTEPVVIDAPSLISPANDAVDISMPVQVTWEENSNGSATYQLQVSTQSDFATTIVDESGLTSATYSVNGLSHETQYYWRVKTTVGVDQSVWSDIWDFTTAAALVINSPSLSSPENGAVDIGIPALLVWEAYSSGSATYQLQVSTQSDFTSTLVDQSGLSSAMYYVDGLSYITQYYWRVKTWVGSDESPWSAVSGFTTYQQQSTVTTSFSFPSRSQNDEYSASDYRIFGLPGNADIDLGDVLGTDFGNTWTAYWDDGSSGNPEDYLMEYDQSSTFRLNNGRAFWIIYNGPIQINEQVNQIELNTNGEAEIPIHTGYNLITCPFTFAVNWADVQALNGTSEPIWRFDGTFSSGSTQLEPFRGYYFFNDIATRTVLRIPYFAPPGTSIIQTNPEWTVNISLETAGLIESTNRIGVSHLAAETNDRFDFHKPRTVGTMPGVYFNRPDWDKIYSTFASDIRPRIDEMERWEFDITTVRGEQSNLTFSGIKNIPDQYEIYLIDISHHQAINLRQQESYQFSSVNESMSFEIIVGEKNRVAKVLRDVIPSEFILGKNYPNPFNPTTTIPLTLPERSSIRLSIYDIMGRYVRTIFNGVLDPGVFYFEWNGKDHNNQKMSSGIYLYHLKTENGINFTGKMIMIK